MKYKFSQTLYALIVFISQKIIIFCFRPKNKRLFFKNIGKGVRIKDTQNGILIDIYVIVKTDCEVNDIVYRIQQNVKNSVTSLLPVKIKAINVHIMDAEKDSL